MLVKKCNFDLQQKKANMKLSKEEINNAMNQAFKTAGNNAFFGTGFEMGVQFIEKKITPELFNEKIIKEYDRKLDSCDKQLYQILSLTRRARRGEKGIDTEGLREDRQRISAARQIYVQIIADLKGGF